MEGVELKEVVLAALNVVVLALQYLVFRYIKFNKMTSNLENTRVIQQIASDLNHVTKSISITMAANGRYEEGPARGSVAPADDDEAAKAARKAALWRGHQQGRSRA